MNRFRTLSGVDLRGKRVLVRADLNVPVEDGQVTDATRIDRFAAGMRPLLEQGARIVILTHFGRPKANVLDPAFSVDKLRPALAKALDRPVAFSDVCIGASAEALAERMKDGQVLLCENLRYHAGEMANDPQFVRDLARLGDIYVNDAFSCAHRAHASTTGLAHVLPSFAGPLLQEELSALSAALDAPSRPSVAIVGGAKVSTKIAVLKNLVTRLDHVIIGGGMANTFLFADGAVMGLSLHEAGEVDTVREIRAQAAASGCTIHLPSDAVIATEFSASAEARVVAPNACPANAMILDAGPASVAAFAAVLEECRTILWNGPLGAFELAPFAAATRGLAQVAARLTQTGQTVSVAGGGDTVAALNAARVTDQFTYVSTAGGAFLEWLEGKTLPGIAALQSAAHAA
ncbi:phosphoglycerate kinase [Pseudoprimorskyibacter insulae]|uniref:Phosphoglycerate kinase n=1 Tax=Pseudoprimorskyibacter insulae TaxID=1695997 RepID=A0A2R8ATW2_9RHOB|nr:phosphoglycerate kinase [Pseudoprimorskyibacter insulae]SPF79491.1 Phosphoglycerate kinase [Pseudoprimorskyibacter insulae]